MMSPHSALLPKMQNVDVDELEYTYVYNFFNQVQLHMHRSR